MTHTSKKFMNNFYKKQAYSSLKRGDIYSRGYLVHTLCIKKSSYNAFKKKLNQRGDC